MTKTALITGASRGLGAALALALAPTHHIIAVAKTTGALEELDDQIKALGGAATLAPMDITNEAAMQTLCRGIYDRWGSLDLWVHAAIHAAPLAPAGMIDAKDLAKSVNANMTATGTLITYMAPLLGTDGAALFFDDTTSGAPFYGSYGATKAAQIALARSWQAETVKTGPRIHIATPHPMPTATRARFHPGEDRAALTDPKIEADRILAEFNG
ncbi:SDR family NAD(P)-dependent oxidoreductase [uncultured Tateyamaria sp.]|uniref:SDR family NAD(P)-dependent oxidoreductase n=1 Tax=uncultured Tateyamaria sp. TaxID=455651 RepID=UPI002603DBBD|nr:SDR family NAD(P)-dependent oxidoreductase [uncultured Tateyamaria sp.]